MRHVNIIGRKSDGCETSADGRKTTWRSNCSAPEWSLPLPATCRNSKRAALVNQAKNYIRNMGMKIS